MYTCYSLSHLEKDSMPRPDRIIVSGELGKITLENSGFADTDIRIGGAIRYPHINQRISSVQPKKPLNKKKVLIALSGGLDESLELISKVVKSLDGLEVDIIVKCHPVLPYIQISRYIGEFSEKLIVSDESIDSLLADTDLVFYTETTVSVEALAQGIPIIHVKSDCRIDMNIFEDLPSVPSDSDSISLQKAAMNALAVSRPIISEENQRFIKCLFSPVRDDIVEMFTT
jgi:surface carbohydrate biosynthesis protein (TIGR04326 family)